MSSYKVTVILSNFNQTWIFSVDFRKNIHISNYVTIRPIDIEFFHADEQTDTLKLTAASRHLAEALNKSRPYRQGFYWSNIVLLRELSSYFQYVRTYLGFSSPSFSAQLTDSVLIFTKSGFTLTQNGTDLLTLCFCSPSIGIPTTGTPRSIASWMLRRPPCFTHSFILGWAVEENIY